MTIEKANINDNEILTELTKKSKAYWGYSNEQIEIWSELLTITKVYIETNHVFKLVLDSKIVGYYSFFITNEETVQLDNLFILPDYMGKGFGRELMNNFLSQLESSNTKKVILESEPNTEKFYSKFGFTKVGEVETSIHGRYLPIMELKLITK